MLGNIYCTIHRNTVKEINVIIGEITEEQKEKLERKVSRAMGAGLQVEWPDGSRQWIVINPLYNFDAVDESGSSGYTWDANGDRIKCEYILKTLASDGDTISKEVIKTRFVHYDKAFA
jgi:hypothetical protein